jgi:hypothetical protein
MIAFCDCDCPLSDCRGWCKNCGDRLGEDERDKEMRDVRTRLAELEAERDAAKAGEARAVEALRKLQSAASYVAEECNEDDWTVDQQAMLDLHEALDAVDVEEPQPALDWLAQREREAVVAELRDWAERWWESHSDFSAGDFKQRIAALTNQQPTACPRSEVRGEENSNA